MKPLTVVFFLAAAISAALGSNLNSVAIIPAPQNLEVHEGVFNLTPKTLIHTDAAGHETGKYLAERLHQSTGYPIRANTKSADANPAKNTILLTTINANTNLGTEGYELAVNSDSVVIRALTSAGLFYGTHSLLQLFPSQVFSPSLVHDVEWQIPAVHIRDEPRFRWRGLMLDVSRHFFNKEEIKRLLDLMAMHKLNTFHWHLVDHDGWRIEIKKYPKLTEVGAWRNDIGYGLDPRTSTAYGSDGRYGGYYTQNEIREVVAYAKSRHIDIVPEIELPGHSRAALDAYPEFYCSGSAGMKPNLQLGVYCAGSDAAFEFLQDVLSEVIALFPGQYVHIGGDEVSKENWLRCPQCQRRMTEERLKNEHELQSYFVRRIGKFLDSHGRTLVGWSEIRQGGLAQNAVMMDWIGGGLESASEGHDVVMSPGDFCYFDHYQSLDYSTEPVAIACYTPLRQVYAFEPIPAKLPLQFHKHILGAQANVWTEYIASANYLDYMTFPRLCALAEVVWSPKDSRAWNDFTRRMQSHYPRLDRLKVKYRDDTSVKIGEWTPSQGSSEAVTLEWDVTDVLIKPDKRQVVIDDISRPITAELVTQPGKCHVLFDHTSGGALKIAWVALLEDGREISRDTHHGLAGPEPRDLVARNVVYVVSLSTGKKGARYTVQARVTAGGADDSHGIVELNPTIRGRPY